MEEENQINISSAIEQTFDRKQKDRYVYVHWDKGLINLHLHSPYNHNGHTL